MDTELGRMIIRLIGDTSSYVESMVTAQTVTERTTQNIATSLQKVEKLVEGFAQTAKGIGQSLAAIGFGNFLQKGLEQFMKIETGMVRLNASITANGGNVEQISASYRDFAKEMANVTLTSRGTVMSLLQQAEGFGLSGANAQRAVQNSIAMAAAKGGEAESYIRSTAMMENGNSARIAMQLGIRGIRNEAERAAAVQLRLANAFGVAKALTETTEGRIAQMTKAFEGLKKELGQVVAKAIAPFVDYITKLSKWLVDLPPTVKTVVASILGIFGAIVSLGGGLATIISIGKALAFLGISVSSVIAPVIGLVTTVTQAFLSMGLAILGLLNPLNVIRLAFTSFSYLIAIAFSPITIVLAIVGVAVAILINELGGFENTWNFIKSTAIAAWEAIKRKVLEFIAFVTPIGRALQGVFEAAWFNLKYTALLVWNTIKDVFNRIYATAVSIWESISSSTGVTWTDVRDFIVGALVITELVIRNFGEIVDGVWSLIEDSVMVAVEAITDFGRAVADLGVESYNWAIGFIQQNSEVIITIVGMVAAVYSVIYVFRLLRFTVVALNAVLAFFRVQQILGIAVWLVWKAVVLGASLVVLTYNTLLGVTAGILAAYGAVVAFVTGIQAAWNVGTALATAATVACSIAVTILKLAIGALIIVLGALVITPIFVIATAAIYGAYYAIEAVVDALSSVSTTTGPLQTITDIFNEWVGMLADVVRAARTNMPLAWNLLRTGFQLAIAQIQSLWPPLWQFIQQGFGIVATLASNIFEARFNLAIMRMAQAVADFSDSFNFISGDAEINRRATAMAQARRDVDTITTRELATARSEFGRITSEFRYTETDEIRRLRGEFAAFRTQITEAPEVEPRVNPNIPEATRAGLQIGQAIGRGVEHGVGRFDAVQRYSAEALTRISDHMDRVRNRGTLAARANQNATAELARAGLGVGAGVRPPEAPRRPDGRFPIVPRPGDANFRGPVQPPPDYLEAIRRFFGMGGGGEVPRVEVPRIEPPRVPAPGDADFVGPRQPTFSETVARDRDEAIATAMRELARTLEFIRGRPEPVVPERPIRDWTPEIDRSLGAFREAWLSLGRDRPPTVAELPPARTEALSREMAEAITRAFRDGVALLPPIRPGEVRPPEIPVRPPEPPRTAAELGVRTVEDALPLPATVIRSFARFLEAGLRVGSIYTHDFSTQKLLGMLINTVQDLRSVPLMVQTNIPQIQTTPIQTDLPTEILDTQQDFYTTVTTSLDTIAFSIISLREVLTELRNEMRRVVTTVPNQDVGRLLTSFLDNVARSLNVRSIVIPEVKVIPQIPIVERLVERNTFTNETEITKETTSRITKDVEKEVETTTSINNTNTTNQVERLFTPNTFIGDTATIAKILPRIERDVNRWVESDLPQVTREVTTPVNRFVESSLPQVTIPSLEVVITQPQLISSQPRQEIISNDDREDKKKVIELLKTNNDYLQIISKKSNSGFDLARLS